MKLDDRLNDFKDGQILTGEEGGTMAIFQFDFAINKGLQRFVELKLHLFVRLG